MKSSALCFLLSLTLLATAKADPVIERVMNRAFKGDSSMVKKASAGKTTPTEMDHLLALLRTLPNGYPPRGGNVAFQRKVNQITRLAEKISAGNREAIAPFANATDCQSCHTLHREPDS